MRALMMLLAVLMAMNGGTFLLLSGCPDADAGPAQASATGDYRPGPAWLHRRMGQVVTLAPIRALTSESAAPSLGAWTPPLP